MADEKKHLNPLAKLLLDIGPLVLFFVVNGRAGIYMATAVFMVAIVLALGISYFLIRRWPIMPLVSAAVVVIFGGLTLYLQNDVFIKVKPTIIYLLFAGVLAFGVVLQKPFLAIVFDSVFHLTDEGWRKLTLRWIAFFVLMAVLNEIVWRTQSTDFWVSFKLFGAIPLTFVFAALQYPLLAKYNAGAEAPAPEEKS